MILDACRNTPEKTALAAKGQNRLGDCLLLSGRAEEALQCYHLAVELAPEDCYPLFNRGRARLALEALAGML